MRITDPRVRHQENGIEVSALVHDFRLWFLLPHGYEPVAVGDAFLACGLAVAMFRAEPLEIDPELPISRRLSDSLSTIQDVYHSWNANLARIEVRCALQEPRPPRPGGASMFSAGVDSLYTLLRHREEIEHLLFICAGFEMGVDDVPSRIAEYADIAARLGKKLIPIQANFWGYKKAFAIDWGLAQAFGLYAVAHLLGFERTFVGASFTYSELFPWGSHPLVDPLWSNGTTTLVHDGAEARRSEKLAFISRSQPWLDALRVCWIRPQGNCGACAKCARTMLGLELLKARSAAFPPFTRSVLKRLRPSEPYEDVYLADLLALALEVESPRIVRSLRWLRTKHRIRQTLLTFDRRFCGSRLRWIHARLFGKPLPLDRILVAVPAHQAAERTAQPPWLPPSPGSRVRL